MNKTGECCLCGGEFKMYGCNPHPLGGGIPENRCCHDCDMGRVIPARISILYGCSREAGKMIARGFDGAINER